MRSLGLIVFGIAVAATPIFSQAPAGTRPSFEVASIKPGTPGLRESPVNQPGRFAANNVSLRMMIGFAYSLRDFQIAGGPSWVTSDRWSIEAKAEEGSKFSTTGPPEPGKTSSVGLALQSLLEDRFALTSHRETRDVPVYALVIDKDGSKLKGVDPPSLPTPGQTPAQPPRPGPGGALPANFTPQPGAVMVGPGLILASAVTMAQMVSVLNRGIDRPIVDRTDLKGFFNVRLQFAAENAPGVATGVAPTDGPPGIPLPATEPQGPSIFTALQEQLGLKLESTKAPVEVMVIDSVRKPTEN